MTGLEPLRRQQGVRSLLGGLLPPRVRGYVRNLSSTARWFQQEAAFALGRKSTIRVRPDWCVCCHPATAVTFEALATNPDCQAELRSFVELCRPSMVLYDIGSHYGAFTLAALRYGGADARVVAVDPSPQTNRMLRYNCRLAGGSDRVEIVAAAIGARGGMLRMTSTGPYAQWFLIAAQDSSGDYETPLYTIGQLAERTQRIPTHIKIDVEGFEHEVLQGGADVIRRHRPTLFVEIHSSLLRSRGVDPVRVLDILGALGYRWIGYEGQSVDSTQYPNASIFRVVCLP